MNKQRKSNASKNDKQFDLIKASVCTFLDCKDIKSLSVQTIDGSLMLSRGFADCNQANAIGFGGDIDDYDDNEDYDAYTIMNKYWGTI